MARSIDRLIRLARKTGDRLIIHDPSEERDIVIMDLDQYEMLIDAQKDLEEYIDDFQAYQNQTIPAPKEVPDQSFFEPAPPATFPEGSVSITPDQHEPAFENIPLPSEDSLHTGLVQSHEGVVQVESDIEHIFSSEETRPVQSEEPKEKKLSSHIPGWTPASSLLEEKFRSLTGQGGNISVPDQEPRQVPMRDLPETEEEYDEDDDEPIFLEEPV